MDTQLIYNYLADLKTGYCNTIEEYKQKITASEIGFRAAYTQYLAETDGKGVNIILSDFQEFQENIDAMAKGETTGISSLRSDIPSRLRRAVLIK